MTNKQCVENAFASMRLAGLEPPYDVACVMQTFFDEKLSVEEVWDLLSVLLPPDRAPTDDVLQDIWQTAVTVYGSEDRAQQFFSESRPELSGRTPQAALDLGETKAVWYLIKSIDFSS